MSVDYLDFDLEIGEGDGRTFPLAVLHSPAGNARTHFDFTLSELELENRLLALEKALLRHVGTRRQILSPDEQTVRDLGCEFFDMLFTGEVRTLFYESRRTALAQGKFLRLRLRVRSPQLAALPWEYLFDTRQDEYVCLSHSTPLVRYLEVPQPPRPLTVSLPLRILGVVTDPSDLASLNVKLEKERLERALAPLRARGQVELEWLDGQTWRDLLRAMRPGRGPWHVVHFIGHGGFDRQRDEGVLAFADASGKSDVRSATEVARMLSGQHSLRLVLLNSCDGAQSSQRDIFSSTAATLVRRGLTAAVAMQYKITDRAAIEFSQTFYEALAEGLPVDAAVTDARRSVSLAIRHTLEWGTPVLFMRSEDGVLFDVAGEATPVAEPAPEPSDLPPESDLAPVIETLSGAQIQALHEVLLNSYDLHSLRFMLRFRLNAPSKILAGSSLAEMAFSSLDWAERTDQLHELAQAVRTDNPDNIKLHFVTEQPPQMRVRFDWVYIPACEFTMGSTAEDKLADDNETPQHILYLPSYWITKVPVTNAQYRFFTRTTGHKQPDHWEFGKFPPGKGNHPVVNVSWHDVMEFCRWTGVNLPSEAEWEKAARGTDGRLWPWGNDRSGEQPYDFEGKTEPVGRDPHSASIFGCLDMVGKISEWTRTLWGDNWERPKFTYPYNPNDGRENVEKYAGTLRVIRGGLYSRTIPNQGVRRRSRRCAYRSWHGTHDRLSYVGFRVVFPASAL